MSGFIVTLVTGIFIGVAIGIIALGIVSSNRFGPKPVHAWRGRAKGASRWHYHEKLAPEFPMDWEVQALTVIED